MYYQLPLLFILLMHIVVDYRNINVDHYVYIGAIIHLLNMLGYYEF